MKNLARAFLAAAGLLVATQASAQAYVGYMPAAPAVAYYAAPVASYGPVVAASPVVATAYYAPQPVYYPAPAPYYVARPVATPYYVAAPVVAPPVAVAPVYGPAVIVRPKVYVRGEPVRNVLRAITP